jgi:hypothetical protein
MATVFNNYVDPTKNKVRYNNQDYEMTLSLANPQGSFFPINTAAILSLIIEENTLQWWKSGSILLKNADNTLERRPNEFFDEQQNYKFRNDGRDLLYVNIKPISQNVIVPQDPLTPDYWELNYTFVVYDVEDFNTGDTTRDKNIRLYFWELDYQLFVETTLNWSTNDVLYALNPELNGRSSELSDTDRKVPTGLAIKSLIQATLDEKSGPQKFSNLWDPGASKIFYSPPTNTYAQEDLEYLFNRHVSSKKFNNVEGDVPFLFRDRYSKMWKLTSYSNYFKGAVTDKSLAGPLQREQFLISTQSAATSIVPVLRKTPQDTTGTLNVSLGQNSSINNFQFVDMASFDNTFLFINTPCASNSLKSKQFSVDFEETSIENVKTFFQKNYIDLFKHSGGANPTALLTLNKSKLQSKSIKQVYSYGTQKYERYPESRNVLLKSGLFLNECLNFTVPGATSREVNIFIGLDRAASQASSVFDEKLLGQWFVTKVKHEFTPNGYTNTITAIKPFADRDIRIEDSVP